MKTVKIMIEIPNHLYKLLKDYPSDSNEGAIENVLIKAVENGTPLDEMIKEIEQRFNIHGYISLYNRAIHDVLDIIHEYTEKRG